MVLDMSVSPSLWPLPLTVEWISGSDVDILKTGT
jgi:hypothetical protein